MPLGMLTCHGLKRIHCGHVDVVTEAKDNTRCLDGYFVNTKVGKSNGSVSNALLVMGPELLTVHVRC